LYWLIGYLVNWLIGFRFNEKSINELTFAPDSSGKLRSFEIHFFLETAERPKEAPACSLEKRISRRELATNSWKRHIKKLAVNSFTDCRF